MAAGMPCPGLEPVFSRFFHFPARYSVFSKNREIANPKQAQQQYQQQLQQQQ
jgi:hypothetical protein